MMKYRRSLDLAESSMAKTPVSWSLLASGQCDMLPRDPTIFPHSPVLFLAAWVTSSIENLAQSKCDPDIVKAKEVNFARQEEQQKLEGDRKTVNGRHGTLENKETQQPGKGPEKDVGERQRE